MMRDFPVFTTDFGVSSLILKEIPYKKQAYICIRDVQDVNFQPHLEECISFCKMAGAEQVFASGHPLLADFPIYTTVLELRGRVKCGGQEIAQLFPVTERTVSRWREIYNRAMQTVDNASTLESRDEKRILESGGAYFIHEDGQLLGIGWMDGNTLLSVAAVIPGMGVRVMHTLLSLAEDQSVTLEVASTNKKALRLYEKLGFLPVREVSTWYRVD